MNQESRSSCGEIVLLLAVLTLLLGVLFFGFGMGRVSAVDGCIEYTPVPPNEPSGVKGCVHYGQGIASHYDGPGVARNDCVWPWDDCTPITITSLDTGMSITVTPMMYGDLYQKPGPNGETRRIVDLDPAAVAALGLSWDQGLYRVTVEPAVAPTEPATVMLPNTAMDR